MRAASSASWRFMVEGYASSRFRSCPAATILRAFAGSGENRPEPGYRRGSAVSYTARQFHQGTRDMIKVQGFAARDAHSALAPFTFERREPGPRDVQIEILYCGICHSDLHQARNDWSNSLYPMVPGHEIVGRVVRVGSQVRKLEAGDFAGVSCMVDSCR